ANLGLTETVNLAAGALEKAKNGADIPDRELFNRNMGSGRAYSAAIDIGGVEGEWTTANFIDWLRERGAFSHPYWVCRGSWTYARNRTITDTECGHINLTGAVVEVFGNDGNHTLRVTTPSTAPRPDHYENSQFTYVFNGTDYFPGWRRDYNTRHRPTAADIGAVKNAEPTAILASQLPARWSENQEVGSLSLENGKWLSYISVRHRAGVGGDSNQYGFVIFDEDMAMPSNDFYIQKQYAGEWRKPVKLYHSANLIPSTIGAITKVDADSNYVRQGSSGVVYKNDDLAWNSPTGAYVKDNEGDTSLIWHMGLNTGSASAAQFHFNYANGGLRYRSSRDGFGFEKPWARIYSDQDKPTAAEIGALSLSEIVGIPMPWPQATAPSGWLKCNGQAFDKNIYPLLAQAYPSGILPDLRGEFVRGWDDGRQIDKGRGLLTLQQATIVGVGDPNISATAIVSLYNNVDNNLSTIASNLNGEIPVKINDDAVKVLSGAGRFDPATASQASMYVRPRNIAFNYIVRAA
ncbi:phage tail protein, partial [Pectobacterium brasiliense]